MKRRSFLAGLLALPLAKFLPAPKLAEVWGVDMGHGSDSTSIWLVNWGDTHKLSIMPGDFVYHARDIRPTNWLKRELNK